MKSKTEDFNHFISIYAPGKTQTVSLAMKVTPNYVPIPSMYLTMDLYLLVTRYT
jgi:hypothetical protein